MDLRQVFLKYTFVLNLALLVLIAYFLAGGINSRLAEKYLGTTVKAEVAPPATAVTPGENFKAPVDSIAKRDLFGSITVGSDETVASLEGDTSAIRETDLRLELVGIYFVADQDPLNIATIKNLKDQEEHLYLVGGKVTDDATVKIIEWNQVILLRSDGRQETLKLVPDDDTPTTNLAQTTPPRRPMRGRPAGANNTDLDLDRIQTTGPNQYVIPRDLLQEALAPQNMSSILTQARTIPNRVREGDQEYIDGFRIFRIRPGSVFDKLGLRNGDVIKSVNGNKLDNFEAAIGMWQGLKDQSSFQISIERQGTPQDLNYEVQ